jgi:ERCC4-related helicase
MLEINFEPRLYQETILESCLKDNTLIVLPTGRGKTKVGILTIIKRLNNYSKTKALFLTPTKPLANQIYEEIKNSTNIENISLFTGAIPPKKRKELWETSRIIVSTPQCIENDLLNKAIDLKQVSTLIIDEVHRAVQDYSYTFIGKEYHKTSMHERIIGLTASPGSNLKKIEEICKNTYAKEIEVRTDNDPDVKPYVQKLEMKKFIINLPEEFKEIKNFLKNSFDSKLLKIREVGVINLPSKPSKTDLLNAQAKLQGELARGSKDYTVFRSISLIAEAIKVSHAIDMLETQGNNSLNKYLDTIFNNSEKRQTKAMKNLLIDLNIKSAYVLSKKLKEKKVKHPKQIKLKEIIQETVKRNPKSKIIIFNTYRDLISELEIDLNELEGINARLFIGQAKKKGVRLLQKEQIEILNKFKEGEYNCLVSSSIGEEGLDIPKVDLVIFYEPTPSAIRHIQRVGRTARTDKGEVIILITKNTKDEAYYWAAFHKEKKMYSSLIEIRKKLRTQKQPTLKEFSNEKTSLVYVDSREGNSGILKKLHDIGVDIKLKSLVTADFIISDRIGIERKTTKDFVNSLIDKRIFSQIKDLRENFEKPLIIIEGEEDIYSIRNIHPNAIKGMLAAITISYGIPIINTKNQKETAELIRVIALREQKPNIKEIGLRLEKKPTSTKDQQEFIIESLPSIGPVTAKNILKKLKSIDKIFSATQEELTSIDGVGEKRAQEIKRIIKEIYEE